ncbi:MAG: hypothetical protein M1812_005671 [Candelaria pacifica]|nr:MAG: hypothetical protein M1812_005671 [Candelaria pacifica]
MSDQIPLKHLYKELGIVFNKTVLMRAVNSFRRKLGGSDQSVFTTEAMQDHTSEPMKTLSKDFLEHAERLHDPALQSELSLWRTPVHRQHSGGDTTFLSPEDAERTHKGLARLFKAQNRSLVNTATERETNQLSYPLAVCPVAGLEDTITLNSIKIEPRIDDMFPPASQTGDGSSFDAIASVSTVADRAFLARPNASTSSTAPVAQMMTATSEGIETSSVIHSDSKPENSESQKNGHVADRMKLRDRLFDRTLDASTSLTTEQSNGFAQQAVHAQLELKGLKHRLPSLETELASEDKTQKRYKRNNSGNFFKSALATPDGPSVAHDPLEPEQLCSKQPAPDHGSGLRKAKGLTHLAALECVVSDSVDPEHNAGNTNASNQDELKNRQPLESKGSSPTSTQKNKPGIISAGPQSTTLVCNNLTEISQKPNSDQDELRSEQSNKGKTSTLNTKVQITLSSDTASNAISTDPEQQSSNNTQSSESSARSKDSIKVRYYILESHHPRPSHKEWINTDLREQSVNSIVDATARLSLY